MGILNTIGSLVIESDGDNSKVLGGLITVLKAHPGGLQSVFDSLRENGLGDYAAALANGLRLPMTSTQITQGLHGTGLLQEIAKHAGVSSEVAQNAMTNALPLWCHISYLVAIN
jgi:uncharacterized protein YidB (DUF937 family)